MNKLYKRFMLDIETLDTETSALVTSVCLTAFDTEDYISIQLNCSIAEQLKLGRTISDSTYDFWKTNCLVKGVPFLGTTDSPLFDRDEIMMKLAEFIMDHVDHQGMELLLVEKELWCNSPQFDLILLNDYMSEFTLSNIFTHKQVFDIRTIKKYLSKDFIDSITLDESLKHTPQADNIYQIKQLNKFEDEYIHSR